MRNVISISLPNNEKKAGYMDPELIKRIRKEYGGISQFFHYAIEKYKRGEL